MLADALGDELEQLMRELLPFYDAPEERVQASTGALADVLRSVASDAEALAGLEQLGREGMVPYEGTFGLMRALGSASGAHEVLARVVPALTDEARLGPSLEATLSGLALELATDSADADAEEDAARLKSLLTREVASDAAEPLLVAERDTRGLPLPLRRDGALPYPFVDADGDGLADRAGAGFAVDAAFTGV